AGRAFNCGYRAALGDPASVRAPVVGMAARAGAAAPPTGTVVPDALPSGPAPQFFSSAPNPSWGTSPSLVEKDKAGRALALAEAGDRVFVEGEFAGLVPPAATRRAATAAPVTARPYLRAIDVTAGAVADG